MNFSGPEKNKKEHRLPLIVILLIMGFFLIFYFFTNSMLDKKNKQLLLQSQSSNQNQIQNSNFYNHQLSPNNNPQLKSKIIDSQIANATDSNQVSSSDFENNGEIYKNILSKVDNITQYLKHQNNIETCLKDLVKLKNEIQHLRSQNERQMEGEEITFDMLAEGLDFIINTPQKQFKNCESLKKRFLADFSPKFEIDFEFEGSKKVFQIIESLCTVVSS